jgi:predicted PurR-regulated permease PerM
MRLPWDKNYFKICFYVIFAFISCYLAKILIDGLIMGISDFDVLLNGMGLILKDIISLLAPLLIGAALAYLLNPLVAFIGKRYALIMGNRNVISFLKPDKEKRTIETAITFIIILSVFFILSWVVVSKGEEINIEAIRDQLTDMFVQIIVTLMEWGIWDYLKNYFENTYISFGEDGSRSDIIEGFFSAGNYVINIAIGIVLAFYFLQRKESILKAVNEYSDRIMPEKLRSSIKSFIQDFNNIFSKYIVGQMLDGCIMALLIWLGLTIIGVDFAIFIGIITGFSNMIPYLGSIVGLVMSIIMALVTGPAIRAVYAGVFMIFLQQLDTIIILPRVVGERVKLSPPLVILSILLFGKVFGLWGMVIAVPLTALVKLRLNRYISRKTKAC